MNYELAYDEDGEPFAVPPQVWGWRVRRAADGRGRPVLVHQHGKPLIVRANASHADLLAAAGPGKYRLEPVDEHRHKVDGIPVACTGPLSTDGEVGPEDEPGESFGGPAVRPVSSLEDALCRVVSANTRMVEKALGQMGSVMTGVAELLHAAHGAGITSRLPPPAPPPPPPPPPVETDDDDQDDQDDQDEPDDEHEHPDESERAELSQAPTSGVSDVVRLIITETVDKLVTLLVDKLTTGGALGGLPLEAFADWRKAAPKPAAPAPPPPAANASTSAAHVATGTSPTVAGEPYSAAHAPYVDTAGASVAPAPSAPAAAAPPAAAGAAPSLTSLGAAPAERPPPLAGDVPRNPEELAAMVNAHILQVWQGLSPPERARASHLIARLTQDERTAWLGELAGLPVPDAIARARAVLQAQPPPSSQP